MPVPKMPWFLVEVFRDFPHWVFQVKSWKMETGDGEDGRGSLQVDQGAD